VPLGCSMGTQGMFFHFWARWSSRITGFCCQTSGKCMVCLPCGELATAYDRVLDAYADLVEFGSVVAPHGHPFIVIQDQIAKTEKRMGEEWFALPEHRSRHHLVL
jgi:hypothetical protein